jgi:hypothetical protein
VDSTGGTNAVNLNFVDSISAGNTNFNVSALTTAGHGTPNVTLNRASLSASLLGLKADGPTATVRVGNSVIFGNVTGVQSLNGGTLQSYGNNQINGNTTDGSIGTIPLH